MSDVFSGMTSDLFELFGLERNFDIDLAELERTYFALQQEFHPDRTMHAKGQERLGLVKMSMRVNDGYKILKNDLKRAEYLLELEGVIVNKDNATIRPSPELLEYVMEQREALEHAKECGTVDRLKAQAQKEREGIITDLKCMLGASRWNEAAQLTTKLQYITKFQAELRTGGQKKKTMADYGEKGRRK